MNRIEACKTCGKHVFADDVIAVPIAEFQALKDAAEQSNSRALISRYRAVSHSRIARNPELAEFILDHFEKMTIIELTAATFKKFGRDAPSRSSIHRFLSSVRRR
ncbi:hypothetical protein [Ensifer soli]|uniref:hypothetical protein n=1 Tax=Ciceribacter sp. sgz301302 TaxID=3342379 RepID=UPI0035BA09D2